jgi:D-sedoheptulose 7-phosphate isomerase
VHPNEFVSAHFSEHKEVVAKSFEHLQKQIDLTADLLTAALANGKKVIAFGNGGSATQASHLVGELIGRFLGNRQPLPAIALAADPGVVTCISNDFGYNVLFERQCQALAAAGDVAIGFTTSGRSENVRLGLAAAREKGATTIALVGASPVQEGFADYVLQVPSKATAHIQEVHLMILHIWCHYIEAQFK